jgi:hypothetical protein
MALKRNYYYLVAGLPDLLIDEGRLKASLESFREEFESALHPDDFELIKLLFLKYDHHNLTRFLKKNFDLFSDKGNFSREFLEEQIKNPDDRIPAYMAEFIRKFKNSERDNAGVTWEAELEHDFIMYIENTIQNEFVLDWFRFFHDFRNANTAIICRKHKISPDKEIVPYNHISQSLLRSNARDFGISQDFSYIEQILAAWDDPNMLERELMLDQIKWNWIDEHTFFHYFTIERMMGFALQLEMAERWLKLDKDKGKELFDKLVTNLGKQYELPEEFNPLYVKRK